MSSNREKILQFYTENAEEGREGRSHSSQMEFRYTEKILRDYIHPVSRVIELGCATGYYGLLFADDCAHYTGVDLSPINISVFQKKIAAAGKENLSAFIGDATDLTEFPDNAFDVVLCLGPMYHLPPEERMLVFRECRRIGTDDAVFAFAYINRLGVYAGACVHDKLRQYYPNRAASKAVLTDSTDDIRPGIFYYTAPEEIETETRENGFLPIKNCGLDFFFAAAAIDEMDEEQFQCYLELADRMSNSPSCTGLANHALLIARKNTE